MGRNAPKETVLPIFIMEREVLTKEEDIANPIKEEELYHSLIQQIHPNHLRSVRRVGALWCVYIYIFSVRNKRAKLLIRGIHVVLKENTQFSLKSRVADQDYIQVTFKELPESAEDSVVTEFRLYMLKQHPSLT